MRPSFGATSRLVTGARCLLAAALCCAPAFSAAAWGQAPKPEPDVIVFLNGDRLTGKLERGIGDSVVFKSDMAGEITVPLAKVKELHSSGSFAVLRKDAPLTRKATAHGTVLFGDGRLTVAAPAGVTESLAPANIAYIIDAPTYDRELATRPGLLFGWHGAVSGGATLVRSTQNGETFNVGTNLVRALPGVAYLPARNRTTFNLLETYGKLTQPVIPQTTPASPDNVAKTSIFHTDAERDQYFTPRFYALAQVSFDHNFSQGLNLQQVYGGGIGWTPIKSAVQQLDVKADVQYEKQQFQAPAVSQNLVGNTFAESYRRVLPKKLIFTESAAILPAWNNANAYSANFMAALALPVYKRLSMNLSTTDSYLNNPPAGFQKNSFQFITGIAYTLK